MVKPPGADCTPNAKEAVSMKTLLKVFFEYQVSGIRYQDFPQSELEGLRNKEQLLYMPTVRQAIYFICQGG